MDVTGDQKGGQWSRSGATTGVVGNGFPLTSSLGDGRDILGAGFHTDVVGMTVDTVCVSFSLPLPLPPPLPPSLSLSLSLSL